MNLSFLTLSNPFQALRLYSFLLVFFSSSLFGCYSNNRSMSLGSGAFTSRQREVLSTQWRTAVDPNSKGKLLTWKLFPEESAAPLLGPNNRIVYVGSSLSHFTAFHSRSGKLLWSKHLQGRIVSQAVVYKDYVYVGTTGGLLYAFDRKTGTERWKYKSSGEILSQPQVAIPTKEIKKPLLIFTTSNNQVYALQAETGKQKWYYGRDLPEKLTIRGQAPVLLHKKSVYTGFSDGYIVSLSLKTGVLQWKRSLQEKERFPDVDSPLVLEKGTLYAASYSGSLHALNPTDGKSKWKHKIVGTAGVSIQEDDVFVSNSEGRVRCLEVTTGKVRWGKLFRAAGSFSTPISNPHFIFLSTNKRGIYVIHRRKGRLLQVIRFGRTSFTATPFLKKSRLYALSNGGFLYNFHIKTP